MEHSGNPVQLADYESPPVVETVLGVQFDKLPALKNATIGAFWSMLDRNEWPAVDDAPQLPMQFERFTTAAKWGQQVQIDFSPVGGSRAQFKNRDNDRMIQIQNGRIFFNWLGEGSKYPRFESVYEGFCSALLKFKQFLEMYGLGQFRPNQWDVTYVNHIPKGAIWSSPEDWNFFKLLGASPNDGLLRSETFTGEWRFQIPEEKGRLYITWQNAKQLVSPNEEIELIRLEWTARGELKPMGDVDAIIREGLHLGRSTIVRSFKSLMSDVANSQWGLK